MLAKLPSSEFQPNQVIFVRDDKDQLKPAKIIMKSSYGTYKIKVYGAKDQQYVSEYQIQLYSDKKAKEILSEIGKNNKKQTKFFKSAQKDNSDFQNKKPIPIKVERFCKEQEEDMEEEGMKNQQNGCRTSKTKYEAILNIKVSTLLDDLKEGKETTFTYSLKDKQQIFKENSKDLLIKKLMWALEDISYLKQSEHTQSTIVDIIESQVIQPVQYVTTALHSKLVLAIETLQRNRQTKFKNYLQSKRNQILGGVQNYLCNFTLFLRVKEGFQKFLIGSEKQEQEMKEGQFEQFQ